MFSKLAKTLVIAGIISIAFVGPALARTASLNHSDGAKVNIQCNKRVCFTQHTNASGRLGNVEPAGPATTVNFVRIIKTWQARGYR